MNNLEATIDTVSESTAKMTDRNMAGVNKGWFKMKKMHEENLQISANIKTKELERN